MYGQMTAGSWIYIGSQGIVQGTYECFAEIARRRFGGSLAGTITLTAGLGGMGGAQPLAVTMNDGVALCIEVDPERIERRLETRYLDERADDLDDAIERCLAAKRERRAAQRRPVRERRRGRPRAAAPRLRRRHRHRPDLAPTTRWSATSRPGSSLAEADELRERDPDEYIQRARASARRALLRDGRLPGRRRRGLRLRQQPAPRGRARRLRARLRLSRASSPRTSGRCSARARGRSAGRRSRAIRPTSPRPTAPCSRSSPTTRRSRAGSGWPAERIAFQGLPARICWLGYGERRRLGPALQRAGRAPARSARRS